MTSTPRRLLFLHTLVGRGGDAVQLLALLETAQRLGFEVIRLGPHRPQPYVFAGLGARARGYARKLPWLVRDALEMALNLWVALQALYASRGAAPAVVIERMTPYSVAGLLVARLRGVPLVIHLDAPFGTERRYRGQGLLTRLHRPLMRAVGRRARLIVLGSEASRAHYVQMGLPRERMVMLPNGVFAEDVAAEPAKAIGEPVVGFVGSMARWHHVDLLIDAVGRLRAEGEAISLWLVGAGEESGALVERVASRGIGSAVRFCGPVSRREALAFIEQFHVAVLPHTLETGSPMKLHEYAARSVAMIAPDLPNLRRVWGEGRLAFFTPGDVASLAGAIRRLLADPEARWRQAEAALQVVRRRYTWERQLAEALATAGLLPGEADSPNAAPAAR